MATHKVVMTLPPRQIKRADAKFVVSRDGRRYGTLQISNGSLVWFPRYSKKGRKMSWTKFDELMEESRRTEKR